MKKTDYILVKEKNLKRAVEKLKELECIVEEKKYSNEKNSNKTRIKTYI